MNDQKARVNRSLPLAIVQRPYTGPFAGHVIPFGSHHPQLAGYVTDSGFTPPPAGFYPPANDYPPQAGPPPTLTPQAAFEQYQYETSRRVHTEDQYGSHCYPLSSPKFHHSASFDQPPPAFGQYQHEHGQQVQDQYGSGYYPRHQGLHNLRDQSHPFESGTYTPSVGLGAGYGSHTRHDYPSQSASEYAPHLDPGYHPQSGYFIEPQRGIVYGQLARNFGGRAQLLLNNVMPGSEPAFEPGRGPGSRAHSRQPVENVPSSTSRMSRVGSHRGDMHGDGVEHEAKEGEGE
jgi:hypothetical protein